MQPKKDVTKAIILVGGWGTRLRPLTLTVPKPLVPFCNRPMLEYQIEKLVQAGVRTIILAVNYFSELIIRECEKYERVFGVEIIYSKEDQPLGTGGPLALARRFLEGHSFFVMNSDICSNADLVAMRDAFVRSDCLAMIMTYPVEDPAKYGLIETDGDRIVSFIEKPKTHEPKRGPWIINAGMYVFSDEILRHIELKETSLETAIFPQLAGRGQLAQFPHDGYWMDIGQIKDYLDGQRLFLSSMPQEKQGRNASPSISAEDNVVIGKNVKIGKNTVLKNCTIFSNTTIGDNCVVKDSVVGWFCALGDNVRIEDTSALGTGVHINEGTHIKSAKVQPNERIHVGNANCPRVNV